MQLFYDSAALYLRAWLGALRPLRRGVDPLTPKRLLVLALFPGFIAVQILNGLCLLLDHLLFPGFRSVELTRPVFVLGIPRSGTTFLHRRLAADPAFTAPTTWEVCLAPSLCQRHIVALAARLDRLLGRPLGRLLAGLLQRYSGDMDAVHPVGLADAEEDYLALLPAGGCFFVHLLFPHAPAFARLATPASLPPARRRRLLRHYHGLLQRHTLFHGGRQLLSKNAAFAGWAPFLVERYPDACLILCIREPTAALTSQLTSLAGARRLFATYPGDRDLEAAFARFFAQWWMALSDFAHTAQPTPMIVEQEWLRGHAAGAIDRIYRELGRTAPPARPDDSAPPAQGSRVQCWQPAESAVAPMQQPYEQLRALARQQLEAAA